MVNNYNYFINHYLTKSYTKYTYTSCQIYELKLKPTANRPFRIPPQRAYEKRPQRAYTCPLEQISQGCQKHQGIGPANTPKQLINYLCFVLRMRRHTPEHMTINKQRQENQEVR